MLNLYPHPEHILKSFNFASVHDHQINKNLPKPLKILYFSDLHTSHTEHHQTTIDQTSYIPYQYTMN